MMSKTVFILSTICVQDSTNIVSHNVQDTVHIVTQDVQDSINIVTHNVQDSVDIKLGYPIP